MVHCRLELGYRPFPMSSKNHHFQLNCLAKVSFICMRISLYTDVYRLSVNKSPAVILYHRRSTDFEEKIERL